MAFDLLRKAWLPVRRRSGKRTWIAPCGLTDDIDRDPVVHPDWGRADFDAATLEFLIGLLATACPPLDVRDWRDRHLSPPSPGDLAAAFSPFAAAFRLDGDGPRFMQELGALAGDLKPVSLLFIEAPGDNTEKKNADLFQKRGRPAVIGLPAAAMALIALQTYAPAGGSGLRTSLRGGGPMTTLALPPDDDSLWRRLWLNVPEAPGPLPEDLSRIFPWMAPTRLSEGKVPPIVEGDIDPRGVFWGMPRRIRLDIVEVPDGGVCDLTGGTAVDLVPSFRTRPWGMNFGTIGHPLSPMYRQKVGSEWLFVHPQPGGLPYRHWVDIATVDDTGSGLRQPARAITTARDRLKVLRAGKGRLWAAGYDMDQAKARGFLEATFPLFTDAQIDEPARQLVGGAQEVAFLTTAAIREASGINSADAALLGAVRETFYARTQSAFFGALERLSAGFSTDMAPADALPPVRRAFLDEALRPAALGLFDIHAPLLRPAAREAERIVRARASLVFALNGQGKRGQSLFRTLSLPLPARKAKEEAEV